MTTAVRSSHLLAISVARTRHLVGAWAEVSILQYFLMEGLAIAAWAGPSPYSRRHNVISDLGAENCGLYSGRAVCSPLHDAMNLSFIAQGVGMLIGALLLSSAVLQVAADVSAAPRPGLGLPRPAQPGRPGQLGALGVRILVAISGVGVLMVGLVPEDRHSPLHYIGALLFFVFGALALLVLGWIWLAQTRVSGFLLLCGALSLTATIVFATVGGLEAGTVERFMAYPITIGLSSAGAVIARRVRRARTMLKATAASPS